MLTPTNVTVAEYNTALAMEEYNHARVTFVVDNVVFQDEELEQGGIQLTTYMNSSENMRFGVAFSTEVVIRLFRSQKTDEINFAHEFTLEFGVDIEDDIEWVQVGYFVGERPVQNLLDDIIELTAHDRITRFDRSANDFVSRLVFPKTIGEIYQSLCEFMVLEPVSGDEIPEVMSKSIANADDWEFETCRDILAAIAEANGCYAKATSDGKIKLIWFSDHTTDYSLLRDNCFGGTIVKLEKSFSKKWGFLENTLWKDVELIQWGEYDNNNNPFYYSYIRNVWQDDNDVVHTVTQPPYDEYSYGRLWANVENYTWDSVSSMKWGEIEAADDTAGKIYVIDQNPFLLYDTEADTKAHLQRILDRLYLFRLYYVASVEMVGNWLVEPGDTVLLEIASNTFTNYPIFNRVLYWNGHCNCNYETTGTLAG